MGLPETPSPPHLYPQALQLKLYQAFIFSIPILFSIILFLLFYLFYLKRRASSLSSPPPILTRTLSQTPSFGQSPCELVLKGKLIEKLPQVLFDEDLRARDSQCCVCLGEYEIKEELIQVPSCKHIFHVDCIQHWLCSNSTCPLCRCSVIPPTSTKLPNNNNTNNPQQPLRNQPAAAEQLHQNTNDQNPNQQHIPHPIVSTLLDLQQHQQQFDGTSSSSSSRSNELSIYMENNSGYRDREQVVVHVQTHISWGN